MKKHYDVVIDGNVTEVREFLGSSLSETVGRAVCSKDDTYGLLTGIGIALGKLNYVRYSIIKNNTVPVDTLMFKNDKLLKSVATDTSNCDGCALKKGEKEYECGCLQCGIHSQFKLIKDFSEKENSISNSYRMKVPAFAEFSGIYNKDPNGDLLPDTISIRNSETGFYEEVRGGDRVRVADPIYLRSTRGPQRDFFIKKGQVFEIREITEDRKFIGINFKGSRVIVRSSAFEVFKPKVYHFNVGDKVRVKSGFLFDKAFSKKEYQENLKEYATDIKNRLEGVYGIIVSMNLNGWCYCQFFSRKNPFTTTTRISVDFLEPASNKEI